ncbi:MAG: universal stress protein [Cyanobacteria bacterium HKST-UBA02]|nr:universal stress protein [Cyanobacteria bacterium HKST-UBA02]
MNDLSIMVCLSGSEGAEHAARFAWSVARTANCSVTAEHVVDASGPTWLLNKLNGGFIDREQIGLCYSSFCASLVDIADALKEKYQSVFSAQRLRGSCNIDYGDPVYKLTRKAMNHNLVFLGHRQGGESPMRGDVISGMTNRCTVPLIVVKSKEASLTRLVMLVSTDHLCPRYLRSCNNLASMLGLEPRIVCVGTTDEPPNLQVLKTQIKNLVPELKDVKMSTRLIEAERGSVELWTRTDQHVDVTARPDTLVIMPTRKQGDRRVTLIGEEIGCFLDRLTLPFVCFWPEEYDHGSVPSRVPAVHSLERSA